MCVYSSYIFPANLNKHRCPRGGRIANVFKHFLFSDRRLHRRLSPGNCWNAADYFLLSWSQNVRRNQVRWRVVVWCEGTPACRQRAMQSRTCTVYYSALMCVGSSFVPAASTAWTPFFMRRLSRVHLSGLWAVARRAGSILCKGISGGRVSL